MFICRDGKVVTRPRKCYIYHLAGKIQHQEPGFSTNQNFQSVYSPLEVKLKIFIIFLFNILHVEYVLCNIW